MLFGLVTGLLLPENLRAFSAGDDPPESRGDDVWTGGGSQVYLGQYQEADIAAVATPPPLAN